MNFIRKFYGKHPVLSNFIIIVVTGLILIWLALIFLNAWTHHGDTAIVPEVKGLSYAQASDRLSEKGLDIIVSDSIYDRSLSPGTVVESMPKAGSEVKGGRPVYVTITSFSPKMVTISMPVTGVSSRQALSYLQALGINSVSIVNVPSGYTDLVLDATVGSQQLFVGASVPVNADVVLKVGSGVEAPDTVEVEVDTVSTETDAQPEIFE